MTPGAAQPRPAWQPFPGPQTAACIATEDEIFFGGAKGGAKSEVVMARPLLQVHKRHYKGLVLRETYQELEEILRRAEDVYSKLAYRPEWQAKAMQYVFPDSGAIVKFGHCAREAHVQRYQGGEWAEIYYDEFANLASPRIRTELLKEIRCKNPNVRRTLFGTGNPGYAGQAWVKRTYIVPTDHGQKVAWVETDVPGLGRVRSSIRFIPSRVTDNPVYRNDPVYMANLYKLPEERRRQMLFGDWDVGHGLAIPELDMAVHVIEPFAPPMHWEIFGGFDWGYTHNWAHSLIASDTEGRCFVVDTLWGRLDVPTDIARAISSWHGDLGLAPKYIAAGHDCWHEKRAHGETGPTIAEVMHNHSLPLVKANQDRIQGLAALQEYTGYRNRLGPGEDGQPMLYFMRTPGNLRLFEQLESAVTDPNDPRKALKVDADPDTGEGGDDGYDTIRYAMMSRPPLAKSQLPEQQLRAWEPHVLAYEERVGRTVKAAPITPPRIDPAVLAHID